MPPKSLKVIQLLPSSLKLLKISPPPVPLPPPPPPPYHHQKPKTKSENHVLTLLTALPKQGLFPSSLNIIAVYKWLFFPSPQKLLGGPLVCIWLQTIKKQKERRKKKLMASYSVPCELVIKHIYKKQTNMIFFKCKKWSKTSAGI